MSLALQLCSTFFAVSKQSVYSSDLYKFILIFSKENEIEIPEIKSFFYWFDCFKSYEKSWAKTQYVELW